MLYHFVIAVLGITGLFGGWVAVQALKRRSDPRFGSRDDVMAGCGSCAGEGFCHVLDSTSADCPNVDARGNHREE
jgi:hypothetical protein